jgi:phospholipid-binding lipoprotein MlaA
VVLASLCIASPGYTDTAGPGLAAGGVPGQAGTVASPPAQAAPEGGGASGDYGDVPEARAGSEGRPQEAPAGDYSDVTGAPARGEDVGKAEGEAPSDEYGDVSDEQVEKEKAAEVHVADPIEPWNRFWFRVNDRLYFWVFKPVARGYAEVVPENVRVWFSNFYRNLGSPIRIANNLLQLKFSRAGTETFRFVVNSTMGFAGLRDCAGDCFGVKPYDEDFGQTLGFYHVGPGIYLVWPVLGPSTLRDTVGYAGDVATYPPTWLLPWSATIPMAVHDRTNGLTFRIGDYEALKKAAIDPYVAVRNAYMQNRVAEIRK